MAKDYKAIIADITAYTGQLRKEVPDTMAGFHAMAKAASAGGAIEGRKLQAWLVSMLSIDTVWPDGWSLSSTRYAHRPQRVVRSA